MRGISIDRNGITEISADALVNAANPSLKEGGGVCDAIFRAAGREELRKACDEIGHCDTGSAVITPGFRSKAKYIIHAVGPVWSGGKSGEPELLYKCYRSALALAKDNGIHSICFPLISSGIYGYPSDEAWDAAIRTCSDYLTDEDCDLHIIFAVPDGDKYREGIRTVESIAPGYLTAVRSNWKAADMPDRNASFILQRHFSKEQMEALCRGNIPQEMEDKWFWYVQDGKLYAHRSWTGSCIYTVSFGEGDTHTVTANRDPGQYGVTDEKEDFETLNKLLDWWSRPVYDHYGQWLSETLDMLGKAAEEDK